MTNTDQDAPAPTEATEPKYALIGAGPMGLAMAKVPGEPGIGVEASHADLTIRPELDRPGGKTVHFTDGSSAGYDMILTATGHLPHYPLVDIQILGWQGRHQQAEMVARHTKGLKTDDRAAKTNQAKKAVKFQRLTGGMNYLNVARMAHHVEKSSYRGAVTGWIKTLGGNAP